MGAMLGAISLGVVCYGGCSQHVWVVSIGAVSMCGLLALVQSACVGC